MPKAAVLVTTITLLLSPTSTMDTKSELASAPNTAAANATVLADQTGRPSTTPIITITGGDSADLDTLDEALARFEQNGLDLPDLEIRFFADEADCGGHHGLFQDHHTPWRILICSDLAFVPTHELAHAWEAANLTPTDRAAYLSVRGLTTWDDHDTPWKERGQEDAAFIIQQNLTATNPQLTTPRWQERINAYATLTGQISPLATNDQPTSGR